MKIDIARLARRTSLAVGLSLATGLAGAAGEGAPPGQELTPKTLYQFLLAEIAGARGQVGLSAELYLDLARATRDPRIARRATEIAMFSRNLPLASEAARLWAEVEPDSEDARRILANVVAAGSDGRLEDLQIQVARALAHSTGERLAQNLMGLNRALQRLPDKEAAQSVVMRVTEPYLDLPEAHFARSQAAMIAQDAMQAMAAIDRAIELRPGWDPAILMKAQILQHAGAGEAAVKQLEAELTRDPGNVALRQAYGRALVATKRFDDARTEFRRLLDAAPNDRDLLYAVALLSVQLNEDAEAEALFRRALDADHPEQDVIRLHLGQLADNRGEGEAARKWFAAVDDARHRLEANIRIAQSLAREKRIDEARTHLQTLKGDDDARRRYVMAEAQILREADRPAEAMLVLDAALARAPDDTDLLYEAAMLAERLDRIDLMEDKLRKVIALKPEHAHAHNALGYSLADRAMRLDEAQALIERALELAPDDPFILDSLGWVYFRRGDLDNALKHLERAYAMRNDAEIAAHLGEVLWNLSRRDDADRLLNEALAAHPDNTLLRDTARRLRAQ